MGNGNQVTKDSLGVLIEEIMTHIKTCPEWIIDSMAITLQNKAALCLGGEKIIRSSDQFEFQF